MKASKIILSLFIAQILCLFVSQSIFCQTETLDIVSYTPPKGWAKTPKEGSIVYTDINKTTGGFCLLTVYASTTSSGNPNTDFTTEWNALVVKPFKAEANPKTESQTNAEGWQGTVGAALIETDGGLKGYAILTVFSGFGKTVSILTILNDESYMAQMTAFVDKIKLDKTKALADSTPPIQNNPSPTNQVDPFPDKPGFQPQQPLAGTVKESITMADLVGIWDNGGAVITSSSSNGNNSGTDITALKENYTIKPDGTFKMNSQARLSNQTVLESDSGTITLSGSYIIVKYNRGVIFKYQYIAFMTLPNGGAVLTLIHLGDTDPLRTPEQLYWSCGHAHGYITCGSSGGEEWVLRPAKPTK